MKSLDREVFSSGWRIIVEQSWRLEPDTQTDFGDRGYCELLLLKGKHAGQIDLSRLPFPVVQLMIQIMQPPGAKAYASCF